MSLTDLLTLMGAAYYYITVLLEINTLVPLLLMIPLFATTLVAINRLFGKYKGLVLNGNFETLQVPLELWTQLPKL